MADAYLRRSPLAHLHLDARAIADAALTDAGIELTELCHRDIINLRGTLGDAAFQTAAKKALGTELPTVPNTSTNAPGGVEVLHLGPDEWLVVTPAGKGDGIGGKLTNALAGLNAAQTPVGDGRTVIRLSGRHARDVLAKGCTIDLQLTAFGPGQCAETVIARSGALVHCVAPGRRKDDTFDIFVAASFAEYLWTWLEDAGGEYGVRVGTG